MSFSEGATSESYLTPSTPEKPAAVTGWDPYEVWRTRILLPRLAKAARSTHQERRWMKWLVGWPVLRRCTHASKTVARAKRAPARRFP
jgi:hypothetical protein